MQQAALHHAEQVRAPSTAPPSDTRSRAWLGAALFVLGTAAVIVIVRYVGAARIAEAVVSLAPVAPWIALLEALRIVADAIATRLLYGVAGRRASWPLLLRAQLIVYPAVLLIPAGRAVGEGVKAALLERRVGRVRAIAAAVLCQVLPLYATAALALPILAVAVWRGGPPALSLAIATTVASAVALATAIVFAARRRALSGLARRLSERWGAGTERVQARLRALGFLPPGPFAASVAGRALLGLQVMLLVAAASDVDVATAVLALGVHLAGLAAGDLIPAQLGATDGSFALAAATLGVDASRAVAVALTLHAVQLVWALVGSLAALSWRRR